MASVRRASGWWWLVAAFVLLVAAVVLGTMIGPASNIHFRNNLILGQGAVTGLAMRPHWWQYTTVRELAAVPACLGDWCLWRSRR